MISQNRPRQGRSTKGRALSSFLAAGLVAICAFGSASQPASGLAAAGVATVPNAPTMASLTPADHGAIARWNAPDSDGGSPITGYQATADPGGATCTTTVGVDTDPLTCVIFGLEVGKTYLVTVQATNAVGTSVDSGPWGRVSSTFNILWHFVDTGVDLSPHSATDVVASGDITVNGPGALNGLQGPDGWYDWSTGVFPSCSAAGSNPGNVWHFLVPIAPCYSLIARIGSNGQPFGVGSTHEIAPSMGRLFLGVNTCQPDMCSREGGTFVTTVSYDKKFTVVPQSSPSPQIGRAHV